jgi:hypothetical protein
MKQPEPTKTYLRELKRLKKTLSETAEKVSLTVIPDMPDKEKYTMIWWLYEAMNRIDTYMKGR